MKRKKSFYLYLYTVFLLVSSLIEPSTSTAHGRFTNGIEEYELTLPHRVTETGEFISFHIPEYFVHSSRGKRSPVQKLHYNVIFEGKDHHIELAPNHRFISPNLVTEVYDSSIPIPHRKIEKLRNALCHYIGHLKGMRHYPVALSLCHGMSGYITTDRGQYYIEPVADHQANEYGQHVHVVYKRNVKDAPSPVPLHCGMKESWSEAWTARLRDVAETLKRSGTESLHRYIELLVVVDKKFIDHHQNEDMEMYILTIMNMVYSYYHDSTVGNQIDVVVVRIIYLDKPDPHIDLEISSNAEVTLSSFCDWAETVNSPDLNNPFHHDISVLLTRYDLCSDNMTDCNLMGLAYLAAACDPKKACAINEDSGLSLGITVTHEVGHVVGCGHDNGDDSPCQPTNPSGEYYVMSPYIHMQTTQWSSCSKQFITELFENNLGECLNDEPQESLYKENDMPPGSVYDADYQCNNVFPGSMHCIIEEAKICEMLYCKQYGSDSCRSNGQPPADGTKCGENKWCYNLKCVEIGQRPAAIDGGWGSWRNWTQCSRTCGGGISYSERDCDNPTPSHRGRYCIGEKKKIKMCNTVDCPPGPTFREQQCSSYNEKPFKSKMHVWKPYIVEDNMCQLNCLNEENTWVTLAPSAKDGTACKPGTKNKCIFGVCRKVGCDWVIDSTAVEDICGVCNGDGSSCKIVENVYKGTGKGYQRIIPIPVGSRNILVNELAATENTIAVANVDGTIFFLNGNFTEDINGDKDLGGVVGVYDHPSIDKETLSVFGPTRVPLVIYAVFYNSHNPGIQYRYAEPVASASQDKSNIMAKATSKSEKGEGHFIWEFLEFGDCSTRCGHGLKTSHPSCVEEEKGKVSDKFCAKLPKPEPKVMECNIRPCKTEWHAREWGPCTGCKQESGTRYRIIDCVVEANQPGKEPMIINSSNCTGTKPASRELCCSNTPCSKLVRKKVRRGRKTEFEKRIANLWKQIDELKEKQRKEKDEVEQGSMISLYKDMVNAKQELLKKTFTDRLLYSQKVTTELPELRHKKYYSIGKRDEKTCSKKSKIKKGKFVGDHVDPLGNKIIEVPLVEPHIDVHLSDAAYEREGDRVVDTLDFCNAKIYTGKHADKEMKRLEKAATKTP